MKRAERDTLLGARAGAELAWWFDEEFYLAAPSRRGRDAARRHRALRARAFPAGRIRRAPRRRIRPWPAPFASGPARRHWNRCSMASPPTETARDCRSPRRSRSAARSWTRAGAPTRARSRNFSGISSTPPAVPGHFDAAAYLAANPDVAARIAAGEFADAAAHWRAAGMAENRLAPFSSVFAGRRASLREIARGGAGVNYLGPLSLASEAGGAARDMVAALEAAGHRRRGGRRLGPARSAGAAWT